MENLFLSSFNQPLNDWVIFFQNVILFSNLVHHNRVPTKFSEKKFHDFPWLFQKIWFFQVFQTLWEPCHNVNSPPLQQTWWQAVAYSISLESFDGSKLDKLFLNAEVMDNSKLILKNFPHLDFKTYKKFNQLEQMSHHHLLILPILDNFGKLLVTKSGHGLRVPVLVCFSRVESLKKLNHLTGTSRCSGSDEAELFAQNSMQNLNLNMFICLSIV